VQWGLKWFEYTLTKFFVHNIIKVNYEGEIMEKINYVALLRGINVGGNNIIKMNELKIIFEEMNLSDVQTYIQTGNVIFRDFEKDKLKLGKRIGKKLFETIKNEIKISLFTLSEIDEIVNKKPYKYGEECEKYKYDVIFLIEPLTVKDAMKEMKKREGVDEVYEGNRVLYFKRLKEKINKTYLTKIIGTPVYKYMTLRNWETTKKLFDLMKNSNDK
jgi:uncharacterized protein (DUF1697 family)